MSVDRHGNNIPIGIAMASDGKIFLANQGFFKCKRRNCYQTSLGNIAVFPAGSNGKANASAVVGGPDTRLAFPSGIAVSNRGNIYISNQGAVCSSRCGCVASGQGSVTVYARGSEGNVKPITTIKGSLTGLGFPQGIAIDSNENIYVLASPRPYFAVAPPACSRQGSVEKRSRTTPRPGDNISTASADIFILPPLYDFGTVGASSILVFKAGSHGDAAPIATIDGPQTTINGSAIAIGPAGP
jgi:sugar lactone lactonase YvrE